MDETQLKADQGTSGYDNAGNVTDDGINQYLYDAEGRICAVAHTPVAGFTILTGYLYDAEGHRVMKGAITAWSCDPAVNGITRAANETDEVLDAEGNQLTELSRNSDGTMAWQHSNVWMQGHLLATGDTNGVHFYLTDPLGTRRVQTDMYGSIEQTCTSLPFGDGESCSPYPTENLFTGKERDTESGNDYFGARYYASSMGRWISPDPTQLWYADPSNPQSMNLYGYGYNNPHRYIDKDGNEVVLALAGAAIGFTTGFVGEWIHDDLSGKGFSWRDSLAYGAGGAATGALAGLTFGGSLLVQAGAAVATSTVGNVGGGLISRGIAGENAWDADSMWTDAKVGFAGGVIGEYFGGLWKAANVTKVRAPIPFGYAGQWAKRFGMGLPKQAANEAGLTSATLGALVGNVGAQINSGMQNQQNQYTPTSNWNEFDLQNLLMNQNCARTGYDDTGNPNGQGSAAMSGCQ